MNNYEAPVVIQMGAAHELILGVKPPDLFLDSEMVWGYYDRQMDIDEVEQTTVE